MVTARGSFEVQMHPQPPESGGDEAVARFLLEKTFAGDLEAVSSGQMLAVNTAVEGSAGYVAMEVVTGDLGGRSGSFILQHNGTMDRGAAALRVAVVPDSGTGELAGITGEMDIEVAGGAHTYRFDYDLPAVG